MRPSKFTKLVLGGMAMGLVALAGCHTQQQVREPAPRPEPVADCNYVPAVGAGMVLNSLAFPTGEAATSAVMVHEVRPREARVGQDYPVEIHVTNRTRGRLQSVMVKADNMQNLAVSSSTPAGNASGGSMMWNLGDLGPCETKVIKVSAKASKTGSSADCLSVSYNNTLCAATAIVEPALIVTKQAPAEVTACDTIVVHYEVKNTGTGVAEGVRVKDTLPAGLTTESGASIVDLDAGTLMAGQAKQATVTLKPSKIGRYESAATASGSGGLSAESAKVATVVKQASLTITSKCSPKIYLGRDITFEFTVKNTSDTPAANTVVNATMPAGSTFVSATMGGTMGGAGVMWNVGTLNAGESKTVAFSVRPSVIGTFKSEASAVGACVNQVANACQTDVAGIPAILVEVTDNPDPVQVGTETTYTITVTNQGSSADSNIKVVCNLPDGEQFVSGGGASNATASGQTVTFATIPTLAPKAVVTYTLRIKAVKGSGDVRMFTDVTSEQFKKAIREEESTTLYE